MRAERRLGELIRAQKETVGLQAGSRGIGKSTSGLPKKRPTLVEAGINHKLSARSQKVAAIPEAKFEGMIGEWRGAHNDSLLNPRNHLPIFAKFHGSSKNR